MLRAPAVHRWRAIFGIEAQQLLPAASTIAPLARKSVAVLVRTATYTREPADDAAGRLSRTRAVTRLSKQPSARRSCGAVARAVARMATSASHPLSPLATLWPRGTGSHRPRDTAKRFHCQCWTGNWVPGGEVTVLLTCQYERSKPSDALTGLPANGSAATAFAQNSPHGSRGSGAPDALGHQKPGTTVLRHRRGTRPLGCTGVPFRPDRSHAAGEGAGFAVLPSLGGALDRAATSAPEVR